jgi:hypothetical protein
LLRCLYVGHGEEQHITIEIKRNLALNVEATLLVHVKVEIEQGQGLRSWLLGLRLNAHKKDLIKNKELINKRNSNLNVKVTPLIYVEDKIG